MKSFFPIAFIAGVSAQSLTSAAQTSAVPTASVVVQIPPGGDQDCLANYIVKQCLQTESDKVHLPCAIKNSAACVRHTHTHTMYTKQKT